MKYSLTLASLCAVVALSKPVDKRWLVTEWDVDTVTLTVTDTITIYPTDDAGSSSAAPAAPITTMSTDTEASPTAPAAATTTIPTDTEASPAAAASTPDSNYSGWPDWSSPLLSPTPSAPSAAESSAPAEGSSTTSTTPTTPWSSPAVAIQSTTSSPAPAPPATSSSPPPAPVQTTVSSDYQQGILDAHNIHRSNASVPGLTWSDSMASIAQQIASSCVYAHNTQAGGGGYGQNIGAGSKNAQVPALINNLMYNGEINFYPLPYGIEPDMSNFEKWGHYSQIVWKSTTQVGCYTQDCSASGLANTGGNVPPFFTVCNYHPPGNFGGQYGANILQPGNAPTVTL